MRDCWHFITRDDLIFTVRGNFHPNGYLRSAGLYFPNKNGKGVYFGKKYSKDVDEFGDKWVEIKHPEHVINDEKGKRIQVPKKDIKRYFDPFDISQDLREFIKTTKWGRLISILEELIPRKDIGFIGSYLIGFPTKDSDIDIIIRGLENLKKIKENFDYILNRLAGVKFLDNHLRGISLKKYHKIYSKRKNDFSRMIDNRWPTIRTKDFMTKLRFVPKENEIKFPVLKNRLKEKFSLKGVVLDDIGTNFMPRFFKVSTKKGNFDVMTYFWDFAYCVEVDDKVDIRGSYDSKNRTLLLSNPKQHGLKFEN